MAPLPLVRGFDVSGIAGVWNVDGRPLEPGVVDGLLSSMSDRALDGAHRWSEGPVGLGCALSRVTPEDEVQPFVHPTGAVIVFDGRLDNRRDLLADLRGRPEVDPLVADLELVIAAYEAFGDGFAERLVGDFALAIFDPVRQWMLLARDPIGVRSLYYFRTQGTFVFASEARAILSHPACDPGPDRTAIARTILGSGAVGGSTPFEGIRAVLPSHLMVLSGGRTVHRRYWDFEGIPQVKLESFGGYAEAFAAQLDRAIRRRLRGSGPVVVPSGAGDIAGEAIRSMILRQKAQVVAAGPSSFGWVQRIEEAVSRSGMLAFERGVDELLAVRDHAGGRVIFSGALDAVPSGKPHLGGWAGRGRGRGISGAPRWGDPASADPNVVGGGSFGRPDRPSIESFSEDIRRRSRGRPPRQIWARKGSGRYSRSVYRYVRSGGLASSLDAMTLVAGRGGHDATFPLLDRDLITFMMSIPGNAGFGSGDGKALLESLVGLGDPGGDEPAGSRWYRDAALGLAGEWPRVTERLLGRGRACELGFVDRSVLEREFPHLHTDVGKGDAPAARDLISLLALESWLEVFV